MIANVDIAESEDIVSFMKAVVTAAVDAPPEAKAAFVENLRRNVERWAAAPERSVHLKFVEDGVVLGVILVRDHWNLCSLFVAPARHRQGIGSALVAAAIARCRSEAAAPAIRLNAACNAVPFYKALGFREVPADRPVLSAIPMEFPL